MIKSRRMRLVEHVERTGDMKNVYKVWVGKPEGKGTTQTLEQTVAQ